MNTKLIIISAALLLTITACDKKTDIAAASKDSIQKTDEATKNITHKAQDPAQAVTENTTKPVKKAAEAETKKTASATKASTEQILAETIDHAQSVTKTQVSASRTRAQKAEDEMLEMNKSK